MVEDTRRYTRTAGVYGLSSLTILGGLVVGVNGRVSTDW